MKIAILGSGRIGAGLGRAWAARGHDVVFGVRDPHDPEVQALARETGAAVTTVADAPAGAAVVTLAVPYGALDAVLAETGDLAGKVVIDCTNAVAPGMTLKYGHTTSAAEQLQQRIPGARVFKSFNAQGAENLARPVYGDLAASNFFCGDDAEGRKMVRQLVEDAGFDPIDAGPLANARLVEPMMLLWMAASRSLGTRDLAFRVLRR